MNKFSSTGTVIATEPPWQRPEFLPAAPRDSYGYLGDGPARTCTLDELRAAVLRPSGERIHFVWTPTESRMIPVAEAPELFEALRTAELHRVRDLIRRKAGWAILAAVGIWWFGPHLGPISWLIMLWTAFFGLPIIDGLVREFEWRRATPKEARARGDDSRFQHWLAWQETTKTTHVIIGALIVTWLLAEQAGALRAIRTFAMEAQGVREGEWWRTLTCFFIHAPAVPVHLGFNCMALSRLGRWVEATTQAAWVPVILLLATLGGSLAGYLLPPDVPSVGASGGILGLLGFLVVFIGPAERQIPRGFRRLLWQWVIFVGLLGLMGWSVIDNAAHLGGFIAGALLAAVANATLPRTVPPVRSRWVWLPGFASAVVLAIVGLWMAWIFWQAGSGHR